MQIPDVTGFALGEATDILKAAGITDLLVITTAPPRDKSIEYHRNSRVVRQKTSADGRTEELLVCNPE